MRSIPVVNVLCTCLIVPAGLLYAGSYYSLRPDDPHAVYLTRDQLDVHADGVGDDSDALQQAIDSVSRGGIVFIPQGRYRLAKTVIVWSGIRLIGYGEERPVFVLTSDTPGFQWGTGKYMFHFAGRRPRGNTPFSDASEVTFYSGMDNINIEIEEGNRAAIAIRFHVVQHSFLRHMDFHIGSARAAIEDIGNQISAINVYGGKYGNAENMHSAVTFTNIACSDVPTFYRGDEVLQAPSQHYVMDKFTVGLEIGQDGREKGVMLRPREHPLSKPASTVSNWYSTMSRTGNSTPYRPKKKTRPDMRQTPCICRTAEIFSLPTPTCTVSPVPYGRPGMA